MTDEYLDAMRDDFEKVVAHLNKELDHPHGSGDTAASGEHQRLCGGSRFVDADEPLATITAPDARTLVVNAWDKSTLTDIERAIANANLGLNPERRPDHPYPVPRAHG